MKMIIFVLLTLQARGEIPDDLSRFEAVRRSRSPIELQERLAEFDEREVLKAACDREMRSQKVPISCLKLQGPTDALVLRCSETAERAELLPPREEWHFLPRACRERVAARQQILEYKRTGKLLE